MFKFYLNPDLRDAICGRKKIWMLPKNLLDIKTSVVLQALTKTEETFYHEGNFQGSKVLVSWFYFLENTTWKKIFGGREGGKQNNYLRELEQIIWFELEVEFEQVFPQSFQQFVVCD